MEIIVYKFYFSINFNLKLLRKKIFPRHLQINKAEPVCHGESFPHSISKYPNPLGYTINNYWVIVEAENNEIGWYSMMSKKAR